MKYFIILDKLTPTNKKERKNKYYDQHNYLCNIV